MGIEKIRSGLSVGGSLAVKDEIKKVPRSDPPEGYKKIANLYIDPKTDDLIVVYLE